MRHTKTCCCNYCKRWFHKVLTRGGTEYFCTMTMWNSSKGMNSLGSHCNLVYFCHLLCCLFQVCFWAGKLWHADLGKKSINVFLFFQSHSPSAHVFLLVFTLSMPLSAFHVFSSQAAKDNLSLISYKIKAYKCLTVFGTFLTTFGKISSQGSYWLDYRPLLHTSWVD